MVWSITSEYPSFDKVVTLVMAHTKDRELKRQLIKLKQLIPQMEGKTIVDAVLLYDQSGK